MPARLNIKICRNFLKTEKFEPKFLNKISGPIFWCCQVARFLKKLNFIDRKTVKKLMRKTENLTRIPEIFLTFLIGLSPGWYAQFLLKIDLGFNVRKTRTKLIFCRSTLLVHDRVCPFRTTSIFPFLSFLSFTFILLFPSSVDGNSSVPQL